MPNFICPYLGSREDADTPYGYPAEGNCCYHARPPAEVDTSYQAEMCLTGSHIICPVYKNSGPLKPLPADIAAKGVGQPASSRILVWLAIVFVLVAFTLLGTWMSRSSASASLPSTMVSTTSNLPQGLLTNTVINSAGTGLRSNTPYQSIANTATPIPSYTPTATHPPCPMPDGWSIYVIGLEDSLFRISVQYSINLDDLLRANCLNSQIIIQPGTLIFVPPMPTATPTITPTATRRIYIQPSSTPWPPNNPLPTRVIPTVNPPTQVPPTAKPPTQAPLPTIAPPPTLEPLPTQEIPPTQEAPPTQEIPPTQEAPPTQESPPTMAAPP